MLEILCFILGFFVGFFVGVYVMFVDHKERVEKGFEPYILGDGTLQWRETPNTASTGQVASSSQSDDNSTAACR